MVRSGNGNVQPFVWSIVWWGEHITALAIIRAQLRLMRHEDQRQHQAHARRQFNGMGRKCMDNYMATQLDGGRDTNIMRFLLG